MDRGLAVLGRETEPVEENGQVVAGIGTGAVRARALQRSAGGVGPVRGVHPPVAEHRPPTRDEPVARTVMPFSGP
ncbi:hypothetical protein [Streptomyces sp. NPDC003697]